MDEKDNTIASLTRANNALKKQLEDLNNARDNSVLAACCCWYVGAAISSVLAVKYELQEFNLKEILFCFVSVYLVLTILIFVISSIVLAVCEYIPKPNGSNSKYVLIFIISPFIVFAALHLLNFV